MPEPGLKNVGSSTDGLSVLWERIPRDTDLVPQVVREHPNAAIAVAADRTGPRPVGANVPAVPIVSGPDVLPSSCPALGVVGWPGPPPLRPEQPLRVLSVPFAAREEDIEAWCDDLARAMPANSVEWLFAVCYHADEALGELLREHGDVVLLPEQDYDAWRLFRRMAMGFRPHVVHSHYILGAQWAQLCGVPVVTTVHDTSGPRDTLFYGSQFADVSARVDTLCDAADYTVRSDSRIGDQYLRLYQAAAYREVDVVMVCNGPERLTTVACERLFRARNVPCRITLVDATGGNLVNALSRWLSEENVQVAEIPGVSMFEAWGQACAPSARHSAVLLDDSTWIGNAGLLPLLREQRRQTADLVVLPAWSGAAPSEPQPGLYSGETIEYVREQQGLHRETFFNSLRCVGSEWDAL